MNPPPPPPVIVHVHQKSCVASALKVLAVLLIVGGLLVALCLSTVKTMIAGVQGAEQRRAARATPEPEGTPSPAATPAAAMRDPRAVPSDAAARAAQRRAAERYPAIAVEGSPENVRFLRLVMRAQTERPEMFDDPEWPTAIAWEAVEGTDAK